MQSHIKKLKTMKIITAVTVIKFSNGLLQAHSCMLSRTPHDAAHIGMMQRNMTHVDKQ